MFYKLRSTSLDFQLFRLHRKLLIPTNTLRSYQLNRTIILLLVQWTISVFVGFDFSVLLYKICDIRVHSITQCRFDSWVNDGHKYVL